MPVDISKDGAMEKALESVMELEAFGRLDYAVNCAGVNGINADHAPTNSTETSVEYFDKVNGLNYRGTWMANRAYLKIMMAQEPLPSHDVETEGREQRGSIVNLSSGLGLIGMPKNRMTPNCPHPHITCHLSRHLAMILTSRIAVYSASKAAIIALTRNDAIDYSEYKIRINCVCPGLIDTPMTTAMGDPGAMKWVVDSTPLKRMGKPNEIADCCVFLSSTRASWIQGQSIVADGGIVLL
jgi:NAD(P)-dependent dehydrogenase (short-subunit alcohol dehydrogenase family)